MSTVTYREDVFVSYIMDENNPLTAGGYQKFYEGYVLQEKGVEESYDNYIEDLKRSI